MHSLKGLPAYLLVLLVHFFITGQNLICRTPSAILTCAIQDLEDFLLHIQGRKIHLSVCN